MSVDTTTLAQLAPGFTADCCTRPTRNTRTRGAFTMDSSTSVPRSLRAAVGIHVDPRAHVARAQQSR
jgi:hypothetical protein